MNTNRVFVGATTPDFPPPAGEQEEGTLYIEPTRILVAQGGEWVPFPETPQMELETLGNNGIGEIQVFGGGKILETYDADGPTSLGLFRVEQGDQKQKTVNIIDGVNVPQGDGSGAVFEVLTWFGGAYFVKIKRRGRDFTEGQAIVFNGELFGSDPVRGELIILVKTLANPA